MCNSKAAIRSFAHSWTADLNGRNIRVNAVSPGPINTPGLSGLAPDQSQSQQFLEFLATTIPLGRLGQPEEVAKTILFLASDDSSFITGTELFVDGGSGQI